MKLFNKWDTSNIKVKEIALEPYIGLKSILIPRTGGRSTYNRLYAPKSHIVERLMNKLMVPGHRGKKHKISSGTCTGKASTVYNAVKRALEIIEKKTGKNPIEVLVRAVENAAPREGITTIEYGGASYLKAVDMAPQKRVDMALKLMAQGAYSKSFGSKRKIEDCLAEEIILASNMEQKSNAIAKKLELERQASASR